MLSNIEAMALKKIAESKLITKIELKAFINSNGGKVSSESLDTITKNLIQKNYITSICPVGSTCFVITQKGTKMLGELD